MGIDVELINERQEAKLAIHDPQMFLTTLATKEWWQLNESKCLRFIDPWGDTIFNQAQVPILLAELEHSAALQTDPGTKAHLEQVCRLVAAAKGEGHTYVKFIGD